MATEPKAARHRGEEMITFLKTVQLAISFGVIALFWLIYPGVMLIFASAAGLCYVVTSIGAIHDNRIAIWLAFVFSTLTAIFAALGVNRYLRNGFDFLVGNFYEHSGIYLPPYLFLVISLGATLVVIVHVASWRWMVRGRRQDRA